MPLPPRAIRSVLDALKPALDAFARANPGPAPGRQPVHTVYGGAHIFKADTAPKLGRIALQMLGEYAPDAAAFAEAMGLSGELAADVRARVAAKLEREPLEDYHVDFEDGYGLRPDDEEDAHAVAAAREAGAALREGLLPPFFGIRLKALDAEFAQRSARTLDLFVGEFLRAGGGKLPLRFVATLPKVCIPEQVAALASLLDALERANGAPSGALKIEIMIETPASILAGDGRAAARALVEAAGGRCALVQFGPYDYTAGLGITSAHRHMLHGASDFARHVTQVALAGSGVALSDGGTQLMPIAPHRPAPGRELSPAQKEENRAAVHAAWRAHYEHVRHALAHGYYQGGDLHPGQLVARYAATYAYFLEGAPAAGARLRNFVDKAARATLSGAVFDDAATGQGLLNFFAAAVNCGALSEAEAAGATGLPLERLKGRSFSAILAGRIGL
ncbi:MAG TPA: phosphoenolpyruvate kinase [Elusimicrobiota bacterium]|nr:phosphoenolpyruvate kinase [Elusimicrobiota bacterium]